jgi:hypothetical protein
MQEAESRASAAMGGILQLTKKQWLNLKD